MNERRQQIPYKRGNNHRHKQNLLKRLPETHARAAAVTVWNALLWCTAVCGAGFCYVKPCGCSVLAFGSKFSFAETPFMNEGRLHLAALKQRLSVV